LLALTYVGRRRLLPEDRYAGANLAQIAWALPESLLADLGEIGTELLAGGLRFAATNAAEIVLRLPKTTPMLIEAQWIDRGVTGTAMLEAAPGKQYDLWSEADSVVLRTLAGDEYRLDLVRRPYERSAPLRPVCYVVMGFGKKVELAAGRELDLDMSYHNIIRPAATAAGYECLRADEVRHAAAIDTPAYNLLYSAELVIADLSTGNLLAVFELGVRLALRPRITIVIAESSFQFPLDYGPLDVLRYEHLGRDLGEKEALRAQADLTQRIKTASGVDSPLYRLLPELVPPARASPSSSESITIPRPTETTARPVCLVIQGFGKKVDLATGRELDLDMSYRSIILPAVTEAGYDCVRLFDADKQFYDLLLKAEFVVADFSTGDLNTTFHLGLCYALRPRSTIVIAEREFKLPFDPRQIVFRPYEHLGPSIGDDEAMRMRRELAGLIGLLRDGFAVDSPVYLSLPDLQPPVLPETARPEETADSPAAEARRAQPKDMAERKPSIRCIREGKGNSDAIVFVHGFTGDGPRTWADLADRIAGRADLAPWDCWTITYATSWLPDITGIWAADADLSKLALHFRAHVNLGALARYQSLVLIAHSMGGLVVQKALVGDAAFAARTSAVILFGTPSGGLVKARSIRFWQRQLADMAKTGPFITSLRAAWQERFGREPPFKFLAVAGERDQFVPPESSIKPFPDDQQAVVSGNHTSMLAPGDDFGVVALIAGRIAAGNPGSALGDPLARAIERGDFRKVVADLYPGREQLDRKALVRLAIALDALGRRDEAYEILATRADLDSDAIGTMAGRLKRKWLLSRRQADGEAAMEHYAKGYALATAANNLPQVYYHGINLAFLEFVLRGDRAAAKRRAQDVLGVCAASQANRSADEWLPATEGEANLLIGDEAAALAAYRRFVGAGKDPWKVSSTYLNARNIAAEYGDRDLARTLGEIFGDADP
jgi:tetratricopeptide (TPR) repeat protein